MRTIICKNYDDMSIQGAKLVYSQLIMKPDCVLGLATGSTPVGMYERLVEMYNEGELDFSQVTTFNLDEYYPISPDNDQSYRYFMNEHLFNHVNIDMDKTHVPNGMSDDVVADCAEYDRNIEEHGGIDLQVLGIGQNGHIGFNEPDVNLNTGTHLTALTQSTIDANARFFKSKDDVPKHAITMGIASILKSRKIILLASGVNKHNAITELLTDSINTESPATMLKVHPDVVLICDKAAYYGE